MDPSARLAADSQSPRKLDSVTFDQLLTQSALDTGLFDLTNTTFIAPTGLVSLAVAVEAAYVRCDEVVLRTQDAAFRTYLARSGFLPLMAPFCRVTPDADGLHHMYDHRLGRNPVLIELTKVTSADDVSALLDRAIDAVRLVRPDRNDAFDVAAMLSELAGNALEHGGGSGYMAMQVYGSGEASFLELAIGDRGPGIRKSLHANPRLPRMADDLQAISQSVRAGISSSQDPTRGTGLHEMLRLVIGHGGSAQIRSGQAKARWRAGRPRGLGFAVPDLDGAQVSISIPAAQGLHSANFSR